MPFSLDPPPQDDEIECARCGAYFYYDLTRCPQCGVNIYEPDDQDHEEFSKNSPDHPGVAETLANRIKAVWRKVTGKPYSADEVFGNALDQAVLYNQLLSKVGGDHDAAERLIAYEQQHTPNGTRKTWIETAIHRWERDNRTQGPSS